MIDFLLEHHFSNIVIIDNNSNYQPLIKYLNSIANHPSIKIDYLKINYGHKVFWDKKDFFKQYSKGYYVLTDPDIVPITNCPKDFMRKFKTILDNNPYISKVGFSLKLDDIPDTNPNKEKILQWEKKFYNDKTQNNNYYAKIDTTFALYPPKNVWSFRRNFYSGIRTKAPYMAIHGGWYFDKNQLTEEQKYYIETANSSASWLADKEGHLKFDVYY